MVTAVLSIVAVSEPDPVEYVDIECQPAAISVDCNNVQMVPLKLKALHRSGADAALLDVFWRLRFMYFVPGWKILKKQLRICSMPERY